MKNNLRKKFWRWFVYKVLKHPESERFPRPLIILKCMLFPIKAIRWTDKEGPQMHKDTWIIEGVEYSSEFFTCFNNLQAGELLYVKWSDGSIRPFQVEKNLIELVKDLRDHFLNCDINGVEAIRQRANEFLAKLEVANDL